MEELPATPSGTVTILRDGTQGLEVLMVQRSSRDADYFSGAWVFPGGKVETEDAGDDERSRALSAAVREAREEAGVQLESEYLLTLNRWEPEPSPRQKRRFSAWIFVAMHDGHFHIDDHEIVDAKWISPAACLEACRKGEMRLAPPTWVTLWQLSQHEYCVGVERWLNSREPEEFYTRHLEVDGHEALVWHGDELVDGSPEARHRLTMYDTGWVYERTISS